MVTFSDPKELRQALVEMDHHMVSSEMTAPEGGLASLVQHVLHVKLTEVCGYKFIRKICYKLFSRRNITITSYNCRRTKKRNSEKQTTDMDEQN